MAKRRYIFEPDALDDFSNWGIVRRALFVRIVSLLKEISRTPFEGRGKPEPLKHKWQGYWSRRIDDEHRLIYTINTDGDVEIASCKGHYD